MTPEIKSMLICWGISILIGIIAVTVSIIKKDRNWFQSSLCFLLVSITPFGVLLSIVLVVIIVVILIGKLTEFLFNNITKNWN